MLIFVFDRFLLKSCLAGGCEEEWPRVLIAATKHLNWPSISTYWISFSLRVIYAIELFTTCHILLGCSAASGKLQWICPDGVHSNCYQIFAMIIFELHHRHADLCVDQLSFTYIFSGSYRSSFFMGERTRWLTVRRGKLIFQWLIITLPFMMLENFFRKRRPADIMKIA